MSYNIEDIDIITHRTWTLSIHDENTDSHTIAELLFKKKTNNNNTNNKRRLVDIEISIQGI